MNKFPGDIDITLLVYQPVSDWLVAVEKRHGREVAERCSQTVVILGGTTETMVDDLKKDRVKIIDEALSALG